MQVVERELVVIAAADARGQDPTYTRSAHSVDLARPKALAQRPQVPPSKSLAIATRDDARDRFRLALITLEENHTSTPVTMADAVPAKPTQDLVLAVFLHGFKGGADTSVGSMCESQPRETRISYSHRNGRYSFAAFPNRLQNTMMARGIGFEPVVYPPYDTRGELIVAGQSLSAVAAFTERIA